MPSGQPNKLQLTVSPLSRDGCSYIVGVAMGGPATRHIMQTRQGPGRWGRKGAGLCAHLAGSCSISGGLCACPGGGRVLLHVLCVLLLHLQPPPQLVSTPQPRCRSTLSPSALHIPATVWESGHVWQDRTHVQKGEQLYMQIRQPLWRACEAGAMEPQFCRACPAAEW